MTDRLFVYWEKRLVGTLSINPKREFVFQYTPEWLNSNEAIRLSKTLPLQIEPFESDLSRPFFANLLPESEIRKLIAKQHGLSEQNDFGLLAAIGGDCAGAISLLPDERHPDLTGDYTLLADTELDQMIEQMPKRPLLTAQGGLRLSLAGAQNKLPITIKDNKYYLPRGSYASSHILKPQIDAFEETVENEVFCMLLARELGLPTPEVTVRNGKHKAYVVKRYDRYEDTGGTLRRIHQEDFCQALGMYPDQKYQNEGGPGFKQCFDLVTQTTQQPLQDKTFLMYWAIFNYLVGNADAHAKNLSMIITREGIRLAPFYDLLSTVVYSDLSSKMAMKIGGQYERKRVTARNWIKFAEEAGISKKKVLSSCQQMCETLPGIANALATRFVTRWGEAPIVQKICDEIAESSRRTLYFLSH